jgi:LacI family transcriptional regulator
MNIRVPEDISVVGNDDIPFSRHVPVQLTTARAPMFELGRRATEILIRNIEAPHPLPIENIVLDTELVIRQSTTALRQAHANKLYENIQTLG